MRIGRGVDPRLLGIVVGALGAGCHSGSAAPNDGGSDRLPVVDGAALGGRGGGAGRGTGGAAGASAGGGGAGGTSAAGGGLGSGGGPINPGDSVLMHHKNPNRDGVYVEPLLTKAAAATLKLDTTFSATFLGAVFAQPLFVDGLGGTDLVIVVTEADTVYAFDASSGRQVWRAALGTPVPLADMPCGNLDPLGITSTPVIDLATRTLFVAAMVTPDGGATKQYEIFGLSIDDGSIRPGWPVDVAGAVSGGTTFEPDVQGQRAALALVNGVVYVPFGGLAGDCGSYHGWVVAVPIATPSQLQAWATAGKGGGIWGPSGIASDGSAIYVTTGNTLGATAWVGGEALFRFPASLPLSTAPTYWVPPTWATLDGFDLDLSGSGPVVFQLPGSTPSHLVFALGKGGDAYLEDADNLGGIVAPMTTTKASSTVVVTATAVYQTATATYVAYRAGGESCTGGNTGTDLATLKILPGAPPRFGGSWCGVATGSGSPIVTTTDGHSDAIVWVVGAEGNNLLQGFDGDTGAVIFAGGAAPIAGVRRYNSPIAAKGRIFVAADGAVVAFTP